MLTETNSSNLSRILDREKRERDDSSKYRGDLLVRQRAINNYAVSDITPYLAPGATIIDACAGPEGSVLASAQRGYNWVGNDISHRFARDLKRSGVNNVVISSFAESPYATGSADAVFFIFALNNIADTSRAVSETNRVLKSNGVALVADPGPTMWVASIINHGLVNDILELPGKKYQHDIPEYFRDKPYTETEYVKDYCERCLGVEPKQIQQELLEIFKRHPDRRQGDFYASELIAAHYYLNIVNEMENNGLKLDKLSIGITARTEDDNWVTQKPLNDINTNNWMEKIAQARKLKGEIEGNINEAVKKSPQKIVFPIMTFVKE